MSLGVRKDTFHYLNFFFLLKKLDLASCQACFLPVQLEEIQSVIFVPFPCRSLSLQPGCAVGVQDCPREGISRQSSRRQHTEVAAPSAPCAGHLQAGASAGDC